VKKILSRRRTTLINIYERPGENTNSFTFINGRKEAILLRRSKKRNETPSQKKMLAARLRRIIVSMVRSSKKKET